MNLESTHAFVTGASRGLGFALARALRLAGAHVTLIARNAGHLESAAARLRAAGGAGGVHPIVADVADKHAIHRIVGEAAAVHGPVDLLVHNASTLGPVPMPALLDTECEDFQRVLDVNLVGPFRLTRAVAGSMAIRGRGTVLAISSDAAVEAYPGWGAYGVSKAALDHLMRTLAAELHDSGVRCLSVDPGEMDTAMHAAAIPDADPATLARPEDVAARIVRLLREGDLADAGRLVAGDDRWTA
jgi:NAD(P)-dependent dehydrogenase (short-subunit alcohol dehydrogenase family)